LKFVTSKKPPLFDSFGALSGVNDAGFGDLYDIIDQIRCNFEIIRHDNACLALNHYLRESYYNVFKDSRSTLRSRHLGKPGGAIGSQPKILSDEKKNTQAYHALIDFIFQTLAWWLIHVLEKQSSHATIIAVLARWSVKLKLIALDPVRWAEQALLRGEDVMRRISHEQKDDERIVIHIPTNDAEARTRLIQFPDDSDLDFFYFLFKSDFRDALFHLFRQIIDNLNAERFYTRKFATFEVRTRMYRSDLDGVLRQVTVQRNEDVEISSDVTSLKHSYIALQLLLSNTQSITPADMDKNSSEVAKIHWHTHLVRSLEPKIGSVSTARLDDVVSALAPLSLMGGSKMVTTLNGLSHTTYAEDNHPPETLQLFLEESPKIEVSLSTGQNVSKNSHIVSSNIVPASRAPLITSIKGKKQLIALHFHARITNDLYRRYRRGSGD
jgi:hypothetical protein